MGIEKITDNAVTIHQEISWFAQVISVRFAHYFKNETAYNSIYEIPLPDYTEHDTYYANFVQENELDFEERFMVMLGLAPNISPALLDSVFVKNPETGRIFTEFGGVKGSTFNGYIPTIETVMFMLSEENFGRRFALNRLFEDEHVFQRKNVIKLGNVGQEDPYFSSTVGVTQDFLDSISTGAYRRPKFGTEFPAKLIETNLQWDDLVLENKVFTALDELRTFVMYGEVLMEDWGMKRKLKPGYRALFYGPPGTGKTMTACLIGKETGRPVFRIDLSMIVSKYVGETEKNLSRVFDAAEDKDWILFFDEADALFGKRTKVQDSHDRYANQEVSYLLQRVEEYRGLVVLATNFRSNLDDAFTRRFQSIINFPMPKPKQRIQLWESGFSEKATLEETVNIKEISAKYEISGGAILNVIQYCSLQAIKRGSNIILKQDLEMGIRRELDKEGRTI